MDDLIIQLQEALAHQGEEIARMSDELYTQQKEIALLRKHITLLQTKIEAAGDPHIRSQDQETPPPHY